MSDKNLDNINLEELREWADYLCEYTGETKESAKIFWGELTAIPELLDEFAYYYKNKELLCKYKVDNFTIADILIWQMDHFRSHMDRSDSVNRYDNNYLLLSTFCTMIMLHKNSDKIKEQFAAETGTDLSEGWTTN